MARTVTVKDTAAAQDYVAVREVSNTQPNIQQPTQIETIADTDTFEGFAGAGMETVTARDILIPRLGIIQALSPQLKKTNSAYIDGCEEGDIVDAGTGEIMPKPVHVIPVLWAKTWIEWAPRQTQRGIVAFHPTEDILLKTKPDEKGKPTLDNGNSIIETAQWYVVNLTAGRRNSFIPMASTQLRASRRWMTLAQGERLKNSAGREYVPPLFYRTYSLETILHQKGDQTWFLWKIGRGPAVPELGDGWKDILEQCTRFRDSLTADQMRADLTAATDDPNTIDHESGEKPM